MSAQLKEVESTDIDLLPANALANPAELFTRSSIDDVIEKIRAAVKIVPDLTTESGRKAIASTAYKVARSKTAIDAAGKGIVEGWKSQAKVIDGLRKHAWDSLESLQAEVRAPLTEWENEQKRIEAEAIEAARIRREAEEAERLADIERREAAIREAEERIAAQQKAEADRIAAEEAEQARIAREELIRIEAAEQAKREAADAVARAEKDKADAIEAARLAAEKAERDQAEAVRQAELRAQQEADRKERERLDQEALAKAEEDRRAASKAHCKKINCAARDALIEGGISESDATTVITMIASGKVPGVSINY